MHNIVPNYFDLYSEPGVTPISIEVTVLGKSSLEVVWEYAPCAGDVTGYLIKYISANDSGNLTTTGNSSNATIQQLQPATVYDVSIASMYSHGISQFSIPVNETTLVQSE